jgi:hypothetical protein
MQVCEERTSVPETEESPLLEATTREQLGKTHQAGKGLVGAVVICELRTLVVVFVLTSHVYKWSIKPFANTSPIYSHSYIG